MIVNLPKSPEGDQNPLSTGLFGLQPDCSFPASQCERGPPPKLGGDRQERLQRRSRYGICRHDCLVPRDADLVLEYQLRLDKKRRGRTEILRGWQVLRQTTPSLKVAPPFSLTIGHRTQEVLGSSTVCRPEGYEQTKFPVVSSPT